MIDDLGDWLPVTYIVLRAEDQYLHGSGTDGAITTESMEVTGALILAALSTSISLPLSHSLAPIIGARLSLFNSLLDVLNPIVSSSNSAPDQLLQTQTCIVAFNSSSSFMV